MENLPNIIGHPKKNAMIKAMVKSLGVVTVAADMSGISRGTHYEWMKEDMLYKEKIEEINDIAIDFAESKLHQLVADKNVTAVMYFLNNKGKSRGYSREGNRMIEDNEVVRNVLYMPHDGRTDEPIDVSYEEVEKLRNTNENKEN